MSNLTKKLDADGEYWVRRAYRAEDYTAPIEAIRDLDGWRGGYLDVDALLAERDGPFVKYREVDCYWRDGKQRCLLHSASREYAIEVEILKFDFCVARPVPPERTYRLAVEVDKRSAARIIHE